MNRAEFEHVIAAAANVVEEDAFVVIGSQAILGHHPDAPPSLLRSMELDIYPKDSPVRAIEIDASLGDGSQFHEAFGYYAHGVGPETAKAPIGWQERLVSVAVQPRIGSERAPVAFCLEIHDLVLAKCAADRDRDREFARDAVNAGLADLSKLRSRMHDLPVDRDRIERIVRFLDGLGA